MRMRYVYQVFGVFELELSTCSRDLRKAMKRVKPEMNN
jgi:hypothetical protein